MQQKTSSEIKSRLRELLRTQELTKQVLSNIYEKIKVTPADVRAFLRTAPEDSLPDVPTKVEVQLLVRQPAMAQEEIDRVKAELRDYTERINTGTSSMSSLAILYSEDAGSARRGGEIGLLLKGSLDPAYAAVAWALTNPAKVSKIVQSEFGYHIIQLIEKRGDRINTRHILRRPKVEDEAIRADLLKLDTLAEEIRRGKATFEQAVAGISQDKDTYRSDGLMYSEQTGTARMEMDELPPEVAAAVAMMNTGEVSKPFRMRDKRGNEVVAIVKLKNRIPQHRANMVDDFQLLQSIVTNQRRIEARRKWVGEKQKQTFVHVSENWKGCALQYQGWQFR
jgi:peptidyl-prolyl cis-trans isomerase SurA